MEREIDGGYKKVAEIKIRRGGGGGGSCIYQPFLLLFCMRVSTGEYCHSVTFSLFILKPSNLGITPPPFQADPLAKYIPKHYEPFFISKHKPR